MRYVIEYGDGAGTYCEHIEAINPIQAYHSSEIEADSIIAIYAEGFIRDKTSEVQEVVNKEIDEMFSTPDRDPIKPPGNRISFTKWRMDRNNVPATCSAQHCEIVEWIEETRCYHI